MKKSKFSVRVLAFVLTFVMVISIVPMSAWAAVHDITTGEQRGLMGIKGDTIGQQGEIHWPVKIYDYHNDGMLFEYSSSWQMDGTVAEESNSAEKGGILYGGGNPMPVTQLGTDYTGKVAYTNYAYATLSKAGNSNGNATNYTIAERNKGKTGLHYVRLTAKNDTELKNKANNFYVTDFVNDHGGAKAKADVRYMVLVYNGSGLNTSQPFSIAATVNSGNTTFKRGNLDSSYNIKNGSWQYVVIDLSKVLADWSDDTEVKKLYRVLLSVDLETAATNGTSSADRVAISHVAYFNNSEEAARYGQKAVAFDKKPGEYLGDLSTHKWNLGNNLPYGLLMSSAGGGWKYWIGGDSENTDSGYNTYRIGYTPYGDDGTNEWLANYHRKNSSGNLIGDSTQIYYVEGATIAANADYQAKYPKDYKNGFNTADLDFDGYDLLTHVTSGQISMGLLEGELKNGVPAYRKETVEYLAKVIQQTLPIPQKAPDGDYNNTYLSGKKDASTYGTDSSGNALDLPQALRNRLGVTFTSGSRRGTTPTLGKYSTTSQKAAQLTGNFIDCVGNISSCMDAAYYLLNNLFVSNSYNQLQDDFRYLTLSGADQNGKNVYVFDAGFTRGAYNTVNNKLSGLTQAEYKEKSKCAVEYSSYHNGGKGTISLGEGAVNAKDLFYYAYDESDLDAGITTRFPFLPVVDAEGTYAGETESYYFLDDGYRSNAKEFDTYNNRNYNYVLASNGEFVYNQTDDLFFEFEGDDDVYLFINDQLVLDLGGAHPISKASLKVNDYVKWAQKVLANPGDYTDAEIKRARALDLEDGEIAKFDFFYMERHGYGANMRIMTNMRITDPDMRVEKKAYQGSKEIEYGGIIDGEYPVEYSFSLKNSGNTKLYNLNFDDNDIGVKLNPADGLLVKGDDTETNTDDVNGYYVTDAHGERLDPQDLTASVWGYEPVTKDGDYLQVGDEYQKVEAGTGTHKYVEVSVKFKDNTELKNFLHILKGEGLDDSTVDDELTQSGSGLWVDAGVTFRGIYYNLTSAQKEEGVFNNTVHVEATTKSDPSNPDSQTLISEDNHRVYLTAIPLFYQWAGHNLFIDYQKVLDDATKEAGNTGSMLHDYQKFFEAVNGDVSKIAIRMSDWEGNILANDYYDHVIREKNPKTNTYGFTTSYPETGTYEFYVTMRYTADKDIPVSELNKDQFAIVRVLIFVTDVKDSTYVLDYGLKTANLDANGELFKNDELLGASSGVEAKLMGVTDGAEAEPYYRDPYKYKSNMNRITFHELDISEDNKIEVNGDDGNTDGYFHVNLNIPETGKKISYDKYSRSYSITNSGTSMVHVEAPPAWSKIYLYYWYDNGVNNAWPGTLMNKTSTGSSSLAIPGNVPHIIISNGTNQTVDININSGQDLWINMSEGKLDANGKIEAKLTYSTTDGKVHAKVPEGWGDVYVHAWDTFGNPLEQWPGTKVEDIDENGYFVMNIPGDITNVLINNGDEKITDNRKQTVDLPVAAGKETWITVNSTPIENTTAPEMYTAVATQSLENVLMHATVPDTWENAYLYYWNSNGRPTGIKWPGLQMEKKDTNTYSVEVPADVEHVVISDGTFRQTENIDVSAGLETWIDVKPLTSSATAHSNKPDDWNNIYFYFYRNGMGSVGTERPGVSGVAHENGTYTVDVPPYATHVVINDGEGKKTKNLALSADTVNNFFIENTGETVITANVPSWWSDVCVYCLNDEGAHVAWPGEKVTPDSNGNITFIVPEGMTKAIINGDTLEGRRETGHIVLGLGLINDVKVNDEYGNVTIKHEAVYHVSANSKVVEPKTGASAEVTYGIDAEEEGFNFVPTDFMDSVYKMWIAVTVHETDMNPSKLRTTIDIGKEVQMYKKVTVLPASVVYYEDTFAGINYADKSTTSNVISHYTTGTGSLSQSVDQNQQYGNDQAYQSSDNSEITGGSLTDVVVKDNKEFASFTFKGTGFEIIGHTHALDPGIAMASVYDESGKLVKQVPVITEFDQGADAGNEKLVSVPIIRVSGLTYGKYTVKLSGVPVFDFTDFDYSKYDPNDPTTHPPVTDSRICIDGVRVYQPIATDGNDGTHDAYLENENGATFTEVRNLVADRKAFSVRYTEDDGLSLSGGTNTWIENRNNFLPSDEKVSWTSHNVNSVLDYLLAGPNNELYMLESNDDEKSALAFYVTETSDAKAHNMQIGIRAMNYNDYVGTVGGKTQATIQYGAMVDGKLVWKQLATTSSSAEQYYTIPYAECPYDAKNNRYQVVLRVGDTTSVDTDMASFTTLKYNGLVLHELNSSEIPDIMYDELHTDILDSNGNSLDSSKFVDFISISEQMASVTVLADSTTTTTEVKGLYTYSKFKNLVDSMTGHSSYNYVLSENSRLFIVNENTPSQELLDTVKLAQMQFAADGYEMDVVWGSETCVENGDIVIKIDSSYSPEQYNLVVKDTATVKAADMRGILYGLNMLQKHFRYANYYLDVNPESNRTRNAIKGFTLTDAPDTAERTVHLDMGRKYFTKEWVKNYIREMSWMGYNAIELHFSEDGGFRIDFWDDKTDFVSPTGNDFSWVCGGQKPSFNTQADDTGYDYSKYLTSAEVKEICEVAKQYHIDVIPSFDTPAHADWLTTAYYNQGKQLTFNYNNTQYTLPAIINYRGSYSVENSKCLNLGDANVKRFAYAMYTDIAAFFKEYAGSTKFNICGDEVILSDKTTDKWDYADFVTYINEVNTLLKNQGYTTRMYNDFADRSDYAAKATTTVPDLASDIEIIFWDGPDNSSSSINSASHWVNDNRVIYSGNQFWTYYVLHRLDKPADKTWLSSNGFWNMDTRNPACTVMLYTRNDENTVYNEWNPTKLHDYGATEYTYSGSQLAGGYFMIWCNYAALNTEVEMWNGVTDKYDSSQFYSLRNRMWANVIKQWNWDINATSAADFAYFTEMVGYMADFPGLSTNSDGCARAATLTVGTEPFGPILPKYTVTFTDYDGTVLSTQQVTQGESAVAPQAPTRLPQGNYTYTFAGWDKVYTNITADTTVVAQYTETTVVDTVGTLEIKLVGGTDVKLTVDDGVERSIGQTFSTKSMLTGSKITVEAQSTSGNKFIGWLNAITGSVVSTDERYTFYTSGNDVLLAAFETDVSGISLVTFKNDKTGQVIEMMYYREDDTSIEFPADIAYPGYEFAGWDHTEAEILEKMANGEDVTVQPEWSIKNKYVSVTVNGGKITKQSLTNEDGKHAAFKAITVTADTPVAGTLFAYWQDKNGNVVSYDAVYKFYPTEDIELTAVYLATDKIDIEIVDTYKPAEKDEIKETTTVYFINNWQWSDVCIHYWGAQETQWPGNSMKKLENKSYDGFDIYSYEIPAGTEGIIFNGMKYDGSGRDQTPNITNLLDGRIYRMGWNDENQALIEENNTIYIGVPDSLKDKTFAAYIWTSENESEWVKLTDKVSDNVYKITVPTKFTSLIIASLSDKEKAAGWDNVETQSVNIDITEESNYLHMHTELDENKKFTGSWGKMTTIYFRNSEKWENIRVDYTTTLGEAQDKITQSIFVDMKSGDDDLYAVMIPQDVDTISFTNSKTTDGLDYTFVVTDKEKLNNAIFDLVESIAVIDYQVIANVSVDSQTYSDSNVVTFSWSVPQQSGYTFVNAGILLVEESNYVESNFNLDSISKGITVFAPSSKYQTATGSHALSQNVAEGSVWKIKAFVQYRDSDGMLHTAYSDTATANK